MEIGKVYVVHNEWIQNPVTGDMPYKIGITKTTVDGRYYGLGLKMPGEFICDFAYEFTENYTTVEKALHDILNKVNVNGEWFNLNEDALGGIQKICEMMGGKLVTDKVEQEIDIINEEKPDFEFEKIIDKWNLQSEMKTVGKSNKFRNIGISGINKGVNYNFTQKNLQEISIALGCWTKKYPNFDIFLKTFDKMEIHGHIFNYFPPPKSRELNDGWKGMIRTDIQKVEIDDIIETMNQLIVETKEKIIDLIKQL